MTRAAERHPGHTERGSVSAFVLLLSVGLTALLGLVAEGGHVMAEREAAMAEAEQAARVGASQLSVPALRSGGIIDGDGIPARAAMFVMAADGHPGTATVVGATVTATVTPYSVATPLLALVGVPSIRITAHASATAVAG